MAVKQQSVAGVGRCQQIRLLPERAVAEMSGLGSPSSAPLPAPCQLAQVQCSWRVGAFGGCDWEQLGAAMFDRFVKWGYLYLLNSGPQLLLVDTSGALGGPLGSQQEVRAGLPCH